jgi:hypothetical protein
MEPQAEADAKKRLPIGLGTSLQVDIESTEIRFKSTLAGVDPGQFLLIKLPISDDVMESLPENSVIVRYLFRGSIFGFRTPVIKVIQDPIRAAFIRYPPEFENYELRSRERYECFLPARIKIKDSEKNGALLDISEEGLRFSIRDRGYTPTFLKQEDEVSVIIHFPETSGEEEFPTVVRRISDEGGRVALGLVFSDLDNEKKGLVSKFVSDLKEFK